MTSRGYSKCEGSEGGGGEAFKKIDEEHLGRCLLESAPVPRLAQPVPAHPGAFEVRYLDGELSQLGRTGREAVWSGKEQSGGQRDRV